jgi:hypothetical protein
VTMYIDEIASLVKENTPKAKVKFSCIERITIECNSEQGDDVVICLDQEGFRVNKRHPVLKSEMRVDTKRLVIVAEREVAKGKS